MGRVIFAFENKDIETRPLRVTLGEIWKTKRRIAKKLGVSMNEIEVITKIYNADTEERRTAQ